MMVPDSPRLRQLYFEEIHVLAGKDAHEKGATRDLNYPAAGSSILRRGICLSILELLHSYCRYVTRSAIQSREKSRELALPPEATSITRMRKFAFVRLLKTQARPQVSAEPPRT